MNRSLAALMTTFVLALAAGCGSGEDAKKPAVDLTSARAIAAALNAAGFACTEWAPNPGAPMAKEDGACTHDGEVIAVTAFTSADQIAKYNQLLHQAGLEPGVPVQGDLWQVLATDRTEATLVQKILGGTIKSQ